MLNINGLTSLGIIVRILLGILIGMVIIILPCSGSFIVVSLRGVGLLAYLVRASFGSSAVFRGGSLYIYMLALSVKQSADLFFESSDLAEDVVYLGFRDLKNLRILLHGTPGHNQGLLEAREGLLSWQDERSVTTTMVYAGQMRPSKKGAPLQLAPVHGSANVDRVGTLMNIATNELADAVNKTHG